MGTKSAKIHLFIHWLINVFSLLVAGNNLRVTVANTVMDTGIGWKY